MPIHTTEQDLVTLAHAAGLVEHLHEQLPDSAVPEEGSDLAEDEENTPSMVYPAAMSRSMMGATADCLVAALHLFRPDNAAGIRPIEVLLRTSLIGASRTAFLLSPEDATERRENAVLLARIDARSADRAWSVLGDFQLTIHHASKTRDLVRALSTSLPGPTIGEEKIIERMVEAVAWRLRKPADAGLLREQLLFMWHGYSGGAHNNFWQGVLSYQGEDDALATTGRLIDNFAVLALAADFGVKILDQRFRAH